MGDNIPKVIDQYSHMLEDVYFHPMIFIMLVLILLAVFYIRYNTWVRMGDGIKNEDKKEFKVYVLSHILIELLIAFIISYIIIKLTNANLTNYIVNCIFAPGIGTIIAIYLDNRFFIKLVEPKSSNSDDKDDDDKDTNIYVNIGSQPNGDTPIFSGGTTTMPIPMKFHDNVREKINSLGTHASDAEIENILNVISDVNDNQQIMSEEIKSMKTDISSIDLTLDTIRETMMTDKKFKLKKSIYECLDQGFATPEQNDIISADFMNYTAMHGNGEIKKLYEDHYLKLSVHEDRRRKSVPVEHDRRKKEKKEETE